MSRTSTINLRCSVAEFEGVHPAARKLSAMITGEPDSDSLTLSVDGKVVPEVRFEKDSWKTVVDTARMCFVLRFSDECRLMMIREKDDNLIVVGRAADEKGTAVLVVSTPSANGNGQKQWSIGIITSAGEELDLIVTPTLDTVVLCEPGGDFTIRCRGAKIKKDHPAAAGIAGTIVGNPTTGTLLFQFDSLKASEGEEPDDYLHSDVELGTDAWNAVVDCGRTCFALKFPKQRRLRAVMGMEEGMMVVGQVKDHEGISILILSIPGAHQRYMEILTEGGERFDIVGLPSHGSVYLCEPGAIPAVGWRIDQELNSIPTDVQVHLTPVMPLLTWNGRVMSFLHWKENAVELMKNVDYRLAVIDFQGGELNIEAQDSPGDVVIIGHRRVNNMPFMIIAVRSTRVGIEVIYPRNLVPKEVVFKGFPERLTCEERGVSETAAA